MGAPWNPWDLAVHRGPGGSSSGTGVAVAARLAPWGIGTDTGGSVRIPASWCGLTGLKTTIGRVSTYGVLPLSTTLDTPGPMTRCVEDAALLYNVLQGPDPNDPLTLRHPVDDPCPKLKAGIAGLRLARMPAVERAVCEPEVLAAYDASLEALAGLGATIVDVTLPRTFAEMGGLVGRIIAAEGYSFVGALVDDPALAVDDDVRPRIQPGRSMLAKDYLAALREREAIKREFAAALRACGRAAYPDDRDRRGSGERDRPERHGRRVYPRGESARLLRPRRAERTERERFADFAADRGPRLRRSDRAAHRVGLRARHAVAPRDAEGPPLTLDVRHGERSGRAPRRPCRLLATTTSVMRGATRRSHPGIPALVRSPAEVAAERQVLAMTRLYSLRSPASSRGRSHQNAASASSISAAIMRNAAPHAARDMPPAKSRV